MLTQNHRQEALSRGYVQAVAAKAGVNCHFPQVDYGIDLSLRSIVELEGRYTEGTEQIDLQIKSTSRWELRNDRIVYDLEANNYRDLRNSQWKIPRILVVMLLPPNESEWLSQTTEELTLRKCAYWLSLNGAPQRDAVSSVRIEIPVVNIFSAEEIARMMKFIQEGTRL